MHDDELDNPIYPPFPQDGSDESHQLLNDCAEVAHLPSQEKPGPRYCRLCGNCLEPDEKECDQCVKHLAGKDSSQLSARNARRPIVSTLWLYFLMLSSTLGAIIFITDKVLAGFLISGFDTVIVSVWVIGNWCRVSDGLKAMGSARWYATAIGAALFTFCVASFVINFLITYIDTDIVELVTPLLDAGYGWAAIILVWCVQPAIVEELAFRGVILSSLQKTMRTREAIFVSALLFMTIHLTVPSFPHLFLIGVVLGYMRVHSGSLYPGMVMHFTHNLLCVVGEGLLKW